jgi:hypothetical protein
MSEQPPFPDPFEFLKRMWTPLGLPMPGIVPPLLDANEIEKRIADLKSVEQWLNMNLNVLRMTIQGLEMQKATLAAMRAMQPNADPAKKQEASGPQSPASAAEAWWNLFQQAQNSPGTKK